MSPIGIAPEPSPAAAAPVPAAAPIHAVLPVIWESGGTGVLRSFLASAWRLGERGRLTWPTVERQGGGPASATLFALLCSFSGTSWYALYVAVGAFFHARGRLHRGLVDSLLAGLGAADAVVLATGALAIFAALLAAGCARFVLRNQPDRPTFGALYRIHCYGQAPAVFGLVGAAVNPALVVLFCVLSRAQGYELVLGIPRRQALVASFAPPAFVAALFVAGLVFVALWNSL